MRNRLIPLALSLVCLAACGPGDPSLGGQDEGSETDSGDGDGDGDGEGDGDGDGDGEGDGDGDGDGDADCVEIEMTQFGARELSIAERDGLIAAAGSHGFVGEEGPSESWALEGTFTYDAELQPPASFHSTDDDSWRELTDVVWTDGHGYRAVGFDRGPDNQDPEYAWLRIGGDEPTDVYVDPDPYDSFHLYSVNQIGDHTIAIGKEYQPDIWRTVISFDLDGNVEWQNRTPGEPKFWSDTTPVDLGDGEVLIASRWQTLDADTGDTVFSPPPLPALEGHEPPQVVDVTRSAPVILSVFSPACVDCMHGTYEVLFLDDALEVQERWEVPTGNQAAGLEHGNEGVYLVSRIGDEHSMLYQLVDGEIEFQERYCQGLYDIEAVENTLILAGWTGPYEKMIGRVVF